METELVISGVGLPPLSARGCVQELVPLAMGQFRRTVNGDLVFLGTNGKKYRTSISCEDKAVIATDGLEVGCQLLIGRVGDRASQNIALEEVIFVVLCEEGQLAARHLASCLYIVVNLIVEAAFQLCA